MKKFEIDNLKELIEILDNLNSLTENTTLFRGQTKPYDLLPSIARKDNAIDTTTIERKMLNELKRRTVYQQLDKFLNNEWEWLIFGQHFGLRTRLLDWSSNPLVALWFSLYKNDADAYIYIFSFPSKDILGDYKNDPFSLTAVEIVKPELNNKRIVSQAGWFTAHPYDGSAQQFIPLNKHEILKKRIWEIKITQRSNNGLFKQLDTMGINAEFIFQDISGTSDYINWLNKI